MTCILAEKDDVEELQYLFEGMDLEKKRCIFVPINDGAGSEKPGSGSHWSLLVFRRRLPDDEDSGSCSGSWEHFDSMQTEKHAAISRVVAAAIVAGVPSLAAREGGPVAADCPQQKNGFDCGAYVCRFAEEICCCEGPAAVAAVTQNSVTAWRKSFAGRLLKAAAAAKGAAGGNKK